MCKALHMFATALGLLQIVHPLTAKRFNERFLQHALAIPSDPSLRGPTLQEILSADRAAWQAIHSLSRDHGWLISDCLNEVAYCRQDIPSALQPRPVPLKLCESMQWKIRLILRLPMLPRGVARPNPLPRATPIPVRILRSRPSFLQLKHLTPVGLNKSTVLTRV